jgi:nicotinamidase-related amidase
MPHNRILEANNSALVVIDIQEAFRNVISGFSAMVSRASIAIRAFQILERPIIVTEQYSKGLGHTVGELRSLLRPDLNPVDKTAFSSCGAGSFIEQLESQGVGQLAVCGLETHVCVNQTVHDLIERGFQVHVLTDAVASRFEADRKAGIAKMTGSGAVPSSVEMAVFEMLRDSKHASFKQVQALLR